MATQEERRKILEMVAAGTITPEEAERLLDAVGAGSSEPSTATATGRTPRWLKIRVTDMKSNKTRVNISIPVMLVKAALKLGARINIGGFNDKSLSNEELKTLEEALLSGEIGKIIDVYDEEEGEHVEIYLE